MAFIKINNVKMKGIAACVPSYIEENSDYPYFDENELDRIMPTIGVERRRVLQKGQTCSDLACKAAERLIDELGWEKDSIGLLMFCSPSRDFIQPDTACILQHRLGLSTDTMCFDMTLGCTAFTYGSTTALSILQNGSIKRALVLNGNMGSAEDAYTDKTTWPLIGDAGTAVAYEYDETASPIYCELGTLGKDYEAIIIPDGGRRNPVNEKSFELIEFDNNIRRSRLHLDMKGMDVFSFAMKIAPKSVNSVLDFANKTIEDVDMFFFHQANFYMVKKIIKKLKINPEDAPFSMINYGNTGAASIPFTMVTEKADLLRNGKRSFVGCSFGVGLSWASIYFETKDLVIPELIEMD